ncbi:hypothetical protein C1631_006400 [Chryseobacterium phosphatilyticum]|uniref:Uncharacterized protein n=1 Tax=Chryseobacterium phosphatilyticum TaxID=475075 RepID=A0A316XHH0_9FLAO|nr:hypothetical protein [Chryseobacterium phosphatilyticum]PWN72226.1 hypothetical protein C1631_006400 [Chryseobacterium phosphatilyticum]
MTLLKMNHFAASFIFMGAFISGQVGINTANPLGTFHVDGKKNNPTSGAPSPVQLSDDFIVSESGNIGLGILSPSVKMDISTSGTPTSPIPGIKITDGLQGNNKVLTSDENGVGKWKRQSLELVVGTMGNGYNLPFSYDYNYHQTGSNIVLPPGKWLVTVNLLSVNNTNSTLDTDDYVWFRSTFSDSQTFTNKSPDIQGTADKVSGMLQGPVSSGSLKYNIANGQLLINNNSGTNKTYWLIVGNAEVIGNPSSSAYLDHLGGSNWGENMISAVPVQ